MSFFITGTGTGVGKTIVTAGLAAWLTQQGYSVCVYKPIQTGSPDTAHPEDPDTIRQLCGDGIATHCTYCFPIPVAPYAADPERTIRMEPLLADLQRLQRTFDIILVEGAGGIRVPIAPGLDMRDLMREFGLPVILVSSPFLGTVNHTLLSVESLQSQRIPVAGVIVSGFPENANEDPAIASLDAMWEDFLSVPLLGNLPHFAIQPGLFQQAETLQAFDVLNLKAFRPISTISGK